MSAIGEFTLRDFLTNVGARTPSPGGGAVACTTGAAGAAIAKMVVEYSIGKKHLAAHEGELARAAATLTRLGALFLALADEDAEAYGLVNELRRLPEDDARRATELPAAIEASVQAPRAALAAAADTLMLIESLVLITNRHLRSDLAIAAVLSEAAAKSAWWNVAVNIPLLPEAPRRAAIAAEAHSQIDLAATRRAAVERGCA